ncbi:MAG: M48 family metalloprotease [Desulfobacteraceae bacterium]|nr:M48 family metalloprotease [Desulfobacteraceae bacterium]
MKTSIIIIACVLMLSPAVFSFDLHKNYSGDRWAYVYGTLSASAHPLVPRVQDVFDRVLRAADKRDNRYPKLMIIRKTGRPWAAALKDGTVILTQKAMEFCYQAEDQTIGDARTAFVLGHELAHLAKDDFWHMAAFEAVQRFGSDKETDQEIIELLIKTGDIDDADRAREIIKKKELQADAYGMLYASMAGYDPRIISDASEGKNFFREWANQITGRLAYSDNRNLHPTPEQRTAFLLSNMKAVNNDLELFDIGVRLCQLGRYKDALAFLETFREKYPCREVFNNIGLINYQLAVRARCDRNRAFQYKLAGILDTETRAMSFIMRQEQCVHAEEFQQKLQQAIQHFRIACKKDKYYVPARVNLSSALIMAGQYSIMPGAVSKAAGVLEEALALNEDDPGALSNQAIAMYLYGPSLKIDMFQQACDALKNLIEKKPDFSDAYYNLGRVLADRKMNAAARETWEKYLNLESAGVYAEIVRETLGIQKKAENQGSSLPAFGEPPVRLGRFDNKTKKFLSGLTRHVLELDTVYGEYYCGKNLRVLVLEDTVELVESSVKQKMNPNYARPVRTFTGYSGKKTLVYENIAVDVLDDMVTGVMYFEN